MKMTWTVYTAQPTDAIGVYTLTGTPWTEEGPQWERSKAHGTISGATKEEADRAAAVMQREYDRVRALVAP